MNVVGDDYVDRLPWRPTSQADYERACGACEFTVVVPNAEVQSVIRAHLAFDRRRKGSHGRALKADLKDKFAEAAAILERPRKYPHLGRTRDAAGGEELEEALSTAKDAMRSRMDCMSFSSKRFGILSGNVTVLGLERIENIYVVY